jgi:hypothetical protein
MPLKTATGEQLRNEGISSVHAQSFLAAAKQEDCVILTRTPGKACLGPLTEGYDAKGFHIKGKSCDWGPMAGFLCVEPFFNKNGVGGAAGNLKAHLHSLADAYETPKDATRGVTCGLVQLEIGEERRSWLLANGYIQQKIDQIVCEGEAPLPGSTVKVPWMMQRDAKTKRWLVFYDPRALPGYKGLKDVDDAQIATFTAKVAELAAAIKAPELPSRFAGYRPLLALTNPYPPYSGADNYKNAVTGDFDLFAVWPRITADGAKEREFAVRVGGMQEGTKKGQIFAAEGNHAIGRVSGNISNGVYMIGQLLNSIIGARTNQARVNRIFHSDEGGRPGIDAVDSSVAFTPDGRIYAFSQDSSEFAAFALECAKAKFALFLNNAWLTPLRKMLGSEAPKVTEDWKLLEKSIRWSEALAAK